jgi:signal transduction histidine kinase
MSRSIVLQPRFRVLAVVAVVLVAVLAALAARADAAAPRASWWLICLDVLVGLAFLISAGIAPGPLAQRMLLASVGVAWLIGSILPIARSWHQSALLIAIGWFASGRPHGARGWLIAGVAAVIAAQLLPQLAVSVVFAMVAVNAVIKERVDPVVAWYPAGAAVSVAGCLGTVWTMSHLPSRPLDPVFAVVGYEVVLLGIALLFPVGARTAVRVRDRMADQLLSDAGGEGIDGLVSVLQRTLGDPALRVYRWQDGTRCYVDDSGTVAAAEEPGWLSVDSGPQPVAAVVTRTAALEDPATAAAVPSAVLLAVTNIRLRENQQRRLRELEASRVRILAAGDRQRQRVGSMLRMEVDPPLHATRDAVQAVQAEFLEPEVAATLEVVAGELTAAADEIEDLALGVAPAELGGGRLADALHTLASRCPLPVSVVVDRVVNGGPAAETALYFVCSEALVNAVKHASATEVTIAVAVQQGELIATITDDGRGGADPAGRGLQGLQDRLATRNGQLRVESPPGAGTTVTATIRP